MQNAESAIIPNPQKLEAIKRAIKNGGPDKFHVLSDFDRTLTYGYLDGNKCPTVIAQIRNGNYLTPDYSPTAHALYDKYAPMERDPHLSYEEKNAAMREWWETHYSLLVKSGLTDKLMDEITAKRELKLRHGAPEFFDKLQNRNIPLIIMSAAPGYMLEKYLEQENHLHKNIHVIANQLRFDDKGNFIGIEEPLIHSLNKYEIILKNFPIFKEVEHRPNVLLLGDQIDDVGMVDGFPFQQLIKIGFLNDKKDEDGYSDRLKQFTEKFDVVLTDDQNMEYINKLITELFTL